MDIIITAPFYIINQSKEQMEEFLKVLNLGLAIFWAIWIPWMILLFGSIWLRKRGYPELNDFIVKYVFYFSKDSIRTRRLRKEAKIRMHGTNKEKVALHNKHNPNYQMMTDSEVFEKYKGVDRDKINIVPVPNFLLNTRTNSLHDDRIVWNYLKKQLYEGMPITPPETREWLKWESVKTYNSLDVDEVNKAEKVFIFPQKTEYFRFITI